jgi:hypothetical protein
MIREDRVPSLQQKKTWLPGAGDKNESSVCDVGQSVFAAAMTGINSKGGCCCAAAADAGAAAEIVVR